MGPSSGVDDIKQSGQNSSNINKFDEKLENVIGSNDTYLLTYLLAYLLKKFIKKFIKWW